MALCDSSAFQLCMANAAMFLDEFHHPTTFQYEKSHEALTYYGQGARQVTRRLADPDECASEGLITCVLGFICHDLYVGTLDRWAYHIHGLKRMVQIRDGFKDLNENLQLFASWFDLVGSAIKDTAPRLQDYSYFQVPSRERVQKSALLAQMIEELGQGSDESGELVLALDEVATVCQFVNLYFRRAGFWRQENDLSSLQVLGPATYLLLSMSRFESTNPSCFLFVHEMMRVALLILLAGLKQAYELAAPEMDLFQSKLYALVTTGTLQEGNFYLLPRLQIWALVTASLFQVSEHQINTYAKEIHKRIPACGFHDGASVLKHSGNILWIERLADTTVLEGLAFNIDQAQSSLV
ncbi:hypothetical protein N7456_001410 [Penicillium angulare]|uniref:Uncharacterized protein n=1 Tax=Penicillium angulare TaxID=116970 RepID=A0A9W9KPB4_9EURO|nr:hypothetical protein N7456_001410 [Penicillium angulare]